MEDLHAVCYQCFHDGDAGGERCESKHQKECDADDPSQSAHGFKYFWQGDKGKAGTGSHSLCSEEYKYRRDDHHTGQEGNTCVKQFNLIGGLRQIYIILYIGAIGDHDPHGYA